MAVFDPEYKHTGLDRIGNIEQYLVNANGGSQPLVGSVYQSKLARETPVGSQSEWPGTGGLASASIAWGNYRTVHYVPGNVGSASGLVLVYPNAYAHEDVLPANSLQVRAGIEISVAGSPVYFPVFFNGQRSVTIEPGGVVRSDPVGLQIAAGTRFLIHTNVFAASGAWPYCEVATGDATVNEGYVEGTGTNTDYSTSALPANSGAGWTYRPWVVLGTPATRSVRVLDVGDSISAGTGDSYQPATGYGAGYLRQAILGTLPLLSIAAGGEIAGQFALDKYRLSRGALAQLATHAVVKLGINDLANLTYNTTVEASLLAIWSYLNALGITVYAATIGPHTNSTDGWITLGNQSLYLDALGGGRADSQRTAINDWLRAGAPIKNGAPVAAGTSGAITFGQTGHPAAGYFEIADAVESGRNSGLFKAADRTVTDAAMTLSSSTLTSNTAAFTSADLNKAVSVVGAGAAGAALTTWIKTVGSATSVTVANTAATAVSGATCGIGTWTRDGLHPSHEAHLAMAAAVNTGLFV